MHRSIGARTLRSSDQTRHPHARPRTTGREESGPTQRRFATHAPQSERRPTCLRIALTQFCHVVAMGRSGNTSARKAAVACSSASLPYDLPMPRSRVSVHPGEKPGSPRPGLGVGAVPVAAGSASAAGPARAAAAPPLDGSGVTAPDPWCESGLLCRLRRCSGRLEGAAVTAGPAVRPQLRVAPKRRDARPAQGADAAAEEAAAAAAL